MGDRYRIKIEEQNGRNLRLYRNKYNILNMVTKFERHNNNDIKKTHTIFI